MCQQFTIKTHFKKSKQVCVNNLPSKHTLKSQNKYVSTLYHQNTLEKVKTSMCQHFTIKTHFKKSKQVCVNNLPSKHTLKSQNKYVSTIYHQNTL